MAMGQTELLEAPVPAPVPLALLHTSIPEQAGVRGGQPSPLLRPPLSRGAGLAAEPAPALDNDREGSTDVPMDSWLYPALERLGALGLVPSQNVAIRPWTRQECRRQIREARDILYGFGALDQDTLPAVRDEAERMLPGMERTLWEPDGASRAVVESAYVRFGTIAGPALADGFHFGQTWQDDFGRPLGRGSSTLLGYSGRITAGRFFLFQP